MALKSVSGALLLTSAMDLKANRFRDGFYLTFNAISQEPQDKGNPVLHYYKVNMYVPVAEKTKWKEQLTPGKVLLVQNGMWKASKIEGYAYPVNTLKVNRKDVQILLDAKKK